jgi:uncharacterized protein
MRCSHCGVCCTETEMMLSQKDIARLKKMGFEQDFFVRMDRQGYALLKNRDGYCVFYNLDKRRCDIYPNRPVGCRVYPVIFDEDKGEVIFDDICKSSSSITLREKELKGKKVVKLLEKIDAEAQKNQHAKKPKLDKKT